MRKITILLLAALLVGLTTTAMADIINGGFEAGDLSGWTTTGTVSVTSAGMDPRTNNNLPMVGLDSHSAMVGDQNAWGYTGPEYSSISQSWTVQAGDPSDLYFAWAAVGLVPGSSSPAHTLDETPYFLIQLDWTHNGSTSTLVSDEHYTGSVGSITPGWLQGATQDWPTNSLGQGDPGIWYYRPWTTFHLDLSVAGVTAGDTLDITLTTRDCTLGGHASYAYLDGFGYDEPPIGTPEPGSLLLLGSGLAALGLKFARLRKS